MTLRISAVLLFLAAASLAATKISPIISAQPEHSASFYVVDFVPGTSQERIANLIASSGLKLQHHPDLPGHVAVLSGRRKDLLALAEKTEVRSAIPASDALVAGEKVYSCAGGVTNDDAGPIGDYIPTDGDGWAGPTHGSTSIGYFIKTSETPESKAAITRALAKWAAHIQVTFYPAASATDPRTVNFVFASGDHGDGYPFAGATGVIAHTFYPAPPNYEPLAGDVHFNAEEPWNAPDGPDLFTVALHEIGHALGLLHSDSPDAVMYPFYQASPGLRIADIQAIHRLYAPRIVIPNMVRNSP